MFPLQPSDDPTTSQVYQIRDDLITDHAFVENNDYLISFSTTNNNTTMGDECNISRRIKHRDIERKRRQQMSDLYVSLRSVLPLQHKGKLSACNQIEEATKHIKYMQKNIQQLRSRRDELEKKYKVSNTGLASSNDCVTVNLVSDGVEILISNTIKSSDLGLSQILVQLELDVVSCVSTRTNGRFLHKILAKAGDMTSLNVQELQDRLTKAIE